MSSKSKQGPQRHETAHIGRGMWGALAGLITAVLIAFPLTATIAYATHPATRTLFGDHLSNTSAAGFSFFWWILSLLLFSLPFLIGFGVSSMSRRWLTITGIVVVILVIVVIVLGQLFAF